MRIPTPHALPPKLSRIQFSVGVDSLEVFAVSMSYNKTHLPGPGASLGFPPLDNTKLSRRPLARLPGVSPKWYSTFCKRKGDQ